MGDTRVMMGMPITVDIVSSGNADLVDEAFSFFDGVDRRFSPYRADSEISRWNRGELAPGEFSSELKTIVALAARTKAETGGYFDIRRADGAIDPCGIVKGWAVHEAAKLLRRAGMADFYVDAGGDIECSGRNANGEAWRVGIRNPFDEQEIVQAVQLVNCGIATSGTYVRGQHIYNPHQPDKQINDIVSLTVIAADVLEADRLATAAFAMGKDGVYFIEGVPGAEAYMIDADGIATQTSGFGAYSLS